VIGVGFLGAAAFQWINPKSWLVCTSAAATFFDPSIGSAHVQAAQLALIFGLVALPCCFVWLAFGAMVQRALRSERAMRTFNIVMGALLAASVVLLFA
jgi:threonine/homoserine/homoserine lactone efflux protein